MPSPVLSEVPAVPSQLVATGANIDGPLSATRFLSAMDDKRLHLPSECVPATVVGIGVFMQMAAPEMGNQTHDEHLIQADEQWSSRREQLASPGRCPSVTI
jgi:hypothetical protein